MKVIISHDIDHLNLSDHFKDLILPKQLVRNHLELLKGKINFSIYANRSKKLFQKKWENINEIMDFNDSRNIKSNFFAGVNNGLGLNYSLDKISPWVSKILARGFEIGVHGIDFENFEKVKVEFEKFKKMHPSEFGIRMHYLRKNESTIENLSKCGYKFDSTEVGFKNPYKVGNMWEFPLQIMEGWVFNEDKRYQNNNLVKAKELTIEMVEKAKESKLEYLNVLFHDVYYCDAYPDWREWYNWVIDYLISQELEFTTYDKAVEELNQKIID